MGDSLEAAHIACESDVEAASGVRGSKRSPRDPLGLPSSKMATGSVVALHATNDQSQRPLRYFRYPP